MGGALVVVQMTFGEGPYSPALNSPFVSRDTGRAFSFFLTDTGYPHVYQHWTRIPEQI